MIVSLGISWIGGVMIGASLMWSYMRRKEDSELWERIEMLDQQKQKIVEQQRILEELSPASVKTDKQKIILIEDGDVIDWIDINPSEETRTEIFDRVMEMVSDYEDATIYINNQEWINLHTETGEVEGESFAIGSTGPMGLGSFEIEGGLLGFLENTIDDRNMQFIEIVVTSPQDD